MRPATTFSAISDVLEMIETAAARVEQAAPALAAGYAVGRIGGRFRRSGREMRHEPLDHRDKLLRGIVRIHRKVRIRRLVRIKRSEVLLRIRLHRFAQRRGVVGRKVAPVVHLIGVVGIAVIPGKLRFLVMQVNQLAVQSADLLGLLVKIE